MTETVTKNGSSLWKYIYAIGGASSLIIAAIFFIALIELMTGTFNLFQKNFVIRLIKLHAEYSESLDKLLQEVNLLDMSILVFVGITALSFYPTLRNISVPLAIIAICQPFIGIFLFLITQEIGRTATFSTALTISVIILWKDRSDRVAILGIVSAGLILIPDISFILIYSEIMSIMMSTGYLLFIPWWFLTSLTLFKQAKVAPLHKVISNDRTT
ncbi:MAG: hypothetical protein JSV04_00360 [Candidatus Heimdallarchaeota archaeon]|nr:MAG: hypothetical protein JSV04_00360 [Candidatus Heimdallarchaeota archaeon]